MKKKKGEKRNKPTTTITTHIPLAREIVLGIQKCKTVLS